MELLVATRNAGKLREIRRLLDAHEIEVKGLEDFPELPEVIEDGDTFAANALKKAREVSALTGKVTLADDSGLVVDALDGRPGVFSARYAGPEANDAANNVKLLADLAGVAAVNRKASFYCALALVCPDGTVHEVSGRVEGEILEQERGTDGFGYDPLFLVHEFKQTMAELPLETKNRISHRGKALKGMLPFLVKLASR